MWSSVKTPLETAGDTCAPAHHLPLGLIPPSWWQGGPPPSDLQLPAWEPPSWVTAEVAL